MDLTELRAGMDAVDAGLVELFVRRMEISAEISAYKQEKGLPVRDPVREEAKLADVSARVRPEFREGVRELYTLLFRLSREYQHSLRTDNQTE